MLLPVLLAGLAGCGLETGGVGGSDVVAGEDVRFEDGASEVEDAPADRDDAWAEEGSPVDVDADGSETPDDVAEADDVGGPDVEPETAEDVGPVDAEDVGPVDVEDVGPVDAEDVGPGEADDAGPADVPPTCSGGLTWCGDACVDTGSDLSNCGECGRACAAPLHAAARCTDGGCAYDCESGYVELAGRCVAFGGAYLHAECGAGGVCRNPNPFTGGCGCPPGFTASLAFRIVNDCADPTYIWANLHFCSAPSFAADSDWGGAYHRHDSGTCAVGNPYTGRCACPAGTVPIAWRVETGSFRFSTVALCWSGTAAEVTFAGAFEMGDVGTVCLVTNPETGGCSCPSGATRVNYRGVFAHGSPYGDWGTQMPICIR
jgi:hypothetical protein